MTTASEISGKNIGQLINEGVLPNASKIPSHGFPERIAFEETIQMTDAFKKYEALLLKRNSKKTDAAKNTAIEMVINLIYSKDEKYGIDFNKYAHRVINQF
jgi:hypothetical protein